MVIIIRRVAKNYSKQFHLIIIIKYMIMAIMVIVVIIVIAVIIVITVN